MDEDQRYSRQSAFFGSDGQNKIKETHAVVVGAGGLGSHLIQQLAFLGVGKITIIDDDKLEDTNLNRLIGFRQGDKIGTPKVNIAERMVKEINPTISVEIICESFISPKGFAALKIANVVFGCIDNDGARLVLNEFCAAYEKLYIDAASDIVLKDSQYGGRVVSVIDNSGCLYCAGEIDSIQAGKDLESPEARKDRETIYGVEKDQLGGTGPSVVTINGLIASLAATEFMLHVTGKRAAKYRLNYLGSRGIVTVSKPEGIDCFYCNSVRGQGDNAKLKRYLSK